MNTETLQEVVQETTFLCCEDSIVLSPKLNQTATRRPDLSRLKPGVTDVLWLTATAKGHLAGYDEEDT